MYRVVIVEDDPMVSLLDRTYTEKDPRFRVVQTFQDGRAALEWLAQNPADLVVLDVYMPLFTGVELLHALRERAIPVDAIMVTAANDAATVDQLLKMGVVDYLVKPFAFARFRQAMDKFLQAQNLLSCPQEGSLLDQQAIDRLIRRQEHPEPGGNQMSKGLNAATLERVRSFLSASRGQALTSEEIAEQVHLSRITIRRYVNYMVETGELASSIDYQTGGRPSIRYSYTGQTSEP